MATRKNKGIGARLGAMLGIAPEKHVTPHIYVSTANETKKRRAHARARAAREKAARVKNAHEKQAVSDDEARSDNDADAEAVSTDEPADARVVPTKGTGTLLKATVAHDAPSAIDEASLADEEGFMQKVKVQKRDVAPRKAIGLWTMFRDRFSRDVPERRAPSTEKVDPVEIVEKPVEPTRIDSTNDSFLSRVSTAPKEPMVRVEVDAPVETTARTTAPSALDEAATGAGVDVAAKKAEVAKALEENKDIVEQQKVAQPAPAPTPQKPPKPKMHAPQFQVPKGFKAFLTSLNYIGMGKERMLFIQNMATMLNAGLPLTDSLKTLVLETRNRSMRKLIQRIIDMVENGSPLWRAMEAQSFFSLHALALVRIGEEAGNLSENMGYLAEQDEKDHALRSKVKMAMIYPTIVMCIMFVIVVGLGMFVLPNLVGVLFSLNVKLPLITRIVIWFSDAFVAYGAVGVPSSIAGFILVMILSKYTPLGRVTQWIMFHIPGIGRLAREATIARFGVILGGLMKAGVPVVEALESLVQVTPVMSYKLLYAQILARVTIGDSFAKCFASIRGSDKLLPASVQQLVITGEKSGSLSDIMLKVADIYDKKASETAEKLPIILEPMLLMFIGALVGSIAFAIIVPIYSIVGNVGG